MLAVVGSEEGLNSGRAGHMHLMDPDLHAAADGIVGAAGPLAVGSAVALTTRHPGSVAVAFHGEAATNQGMLMEAYNMAVAWQLPVLFVCKDNRWSITTYSPAVTGGTIVERARSFGLRVASVDGSDVRRVHTAAGRLLDRARAGKGPGFLHVACHRPDGHFEGDPLVMLLREPARMTGEWAPGLKAAATDPAGGSTMARSAGLRTIASRGMRAAWDWGRRSRRDPLRRTRALLDDDVADAIDRKEAEPIAEAARHAREAVVGRSQFGGQR